MKTTEHHRGAFASQKKLPFQERQKETEGEAQAEPKNRLSEANYVTLGYLRMYAEGVHGYQLGRVLSRSLLRIPSLRLPQLYRVLRRLEQVGLVGCSVEAASSRLRYLFTITPLGESSFRRWLTGSHHTSHLTPDQLISRLQFADHLSAGALLGLIDDAARASQRDLENLRRHAGYGTNSAPATNELYLMALETRLAAEQGWLADVRKLVGQSLASAHAAAGMVQACAP